MPPGDSQAERILKSAREVFEEIEALEEARLSEMHQEGAQARGIPQYREDREAVRQHARMAVQNEPELVLSRAAALLACICLLRLHNHHWNDYFIASHLSSSFPEVSIHARDVDILFRATCRNRPDWVRAMRHVNDSDQAAIAGEMLSVLRAAALHHMVRIPQEHDPRAAIKYLWQLVDVGAGDRY